MGLVTVANNAISVSNEVGCTVSVTLDITGPLDLYPGDTVNYEITVTPTAAVWSFDVSVDNDSATEGPYQYTVQGTSSVSAAKTRLFGGNILDPGESLF